jgi:hypothetical protein
MPLVSTKIRNSAKGKPCTFREPEFCNNDPSTTVFCHGPDKHRGKASKTDDYWGAYGCSGCHYAIDHKQVEPNWLEAIHETQQMLHEAGLMLFPETVKKPKKSTKTRPPARGGIARQYR